MNKQNNHASHQDIEKDLEQKLKKREKKKKPAMRVSGASVRQLQRIIKAKSA